MLGHNSFSWAIREGDRAAFFVKAKKSSATITRDRISVCGLSFSGTKLIGRPYGRHEIAGIELIVLPALPRDLMEHIKRGPQVILPWDASTIIFYADIRAGKTIIEAGSGSGSLTIALASSVRPDGRVISVDIKSSNTEIARRNVRKAGFSDHVIFHTGDVKK
ncbi:MAG: methyltransferase domain-containing protein, partial [Thermoplasmata archaeon]|nr:methyltransferase domain-containing protein [Thermoplasmata archaeon]